MPSARRSDENGRMHKNTRPVHRLVPVVLIVVGVAAAIMFARIVDKAQWWWLWGW